MILVVNSYRIELDVYDCRVFLSLMDLKPKTSSEIAKIWKDNNRKNYDKSCIRLYNQQIPIFEYNRKGKELNIRILSKKQNKLNIDDLKKSRGKIPEFKYSLKEESLIHILLSKYPINLPKKDMELAYSYLQGFIHSHLSNVLFSNLNTKRFWIMEESKNHIPEILLEDMFEYLFMAVFDIKLKQKKKDPKISEKELNKLLKQSKSL